MQILILRTVVDHCIFAVQLGCGLNVQCILALGHNILAADGISIHIPLACMVLALLHRDQAVLLLTVDIDVILRTLNFRRRILRHHQTLLGNSRLIGITVIQCSQIIADYIDSAFFILGEHLALHLRLITGHIHALCSNNVITILLHSRVSYCVLQLVVRRQLPAVLGRDFHRAFSHLGLTVKAGAHRAGGNGRGVIVCLFDHNHRHFLVSRIGGNTANGQLRCRLVNGKVLRSRTGEVTGHCFIAVAGLIRGLKVQYIIAICHKGNGRCPAVRAVLPTERRYTGHCNPLTI